VTPLNTTTATKKMACDHVCLCVLKAQLMGDAICLRASAEEKAIEIIA
jgi:hypothetical protein